MSKNAKISITTQELDFLRYYADLGSDTFGNAYQSALKAGYMKSYARVVRRHYHPWRMKWLKKALKDEKLIKIVDASRNMKDTGISYISEEKMRKIRSKGEREHYGMTAQEIIRELDDLLGRI